jgi:hypothetical protein
VTPKQRDRMFDKIGARLDAIERERLRVRTLIAELQAAAPYTAADLRAAEACDLLRDARERLACARDYTSLAVRAIGPDGTIVARE